MLSLADSAAELAYVLTGLQDNFDLDNFESMRREALSALISCCPVKSTP